MIDVIGSCPSGMTDQHLYTPYFNTNVLGYVRTESIYPPLSRYPYLVTSRHVSNPLDRRTPLT